MKSPHALLWLWLALTIVVHGQTVESEIVINEIHYNPNIATEAVEFIELFNNSDQAVDLSGWRFSEGIEHTFAAGAAITARSYFVLCQNKAHFDRKYARPADAQWTAGTLSNSGERVTLLNAKGAVADTVGYQDSFPWPASADGGGGSLELIHSGVDNDLAGHWRAGAVVKAGEWRASPGEKNASASETVPPAIRQVEHLPNAPKTGETVRVQAKITDGEGVKSAKLLYQEVPPGAYLRLTDADYATRWTEILMKDDGAGGDATAADGTYTATLPAEFVKHRYLIRYRVVAEDQTGASVTVPYADDLQPNFALFVYDGLPAWTGASRPGATPARTFTPAEMQVLPTYHLIAHETDVTRSQYTTSFDGRRFRGTMVYDGEVYDHIQFTNRGEFSTYQSGKNKWRFFFSRGHRFKAKDDYGVPYAQPLREMNFNACASPWVPANRGMAGMEEAVSYKLHALSGVPSPKTHHLHFRVIDKAEETSSTSQYEGDLWGLYMFLEHPDGQFISRLGLPDGNIYKVESGQGDKKHQGPLPPLDNSDYRTFDTGTKRSGQTIEWWRANLNLPVYYSFHATNRVTANIDIRQGWNHFFYHDPSGPWSPIPWDLDMMFMPETHWSGIIDSSNCLKQAELMIEYRNRCRELMDLLYGDPSTQAGQVGAVVEELAQWLKPAWAELDEFMWNNHPKTTGGHKGAFNKTPVSQSFQGGTLRRTLKTPDFLGYLQYLKDFATDTDTTPFKVGDGDQNGYGYNYLRLEATDANTPGTPTIEYMGPAGYPLDQLRFKTGEFAPAVLDSEVQKFGAISWRIAEIYNPSVPGYQANEPWRHEVNAVWQSESTIYSAEMTAPIRALRAGSYYVARVRMKAETGQWSHWSKPLYFTAGSPDLTAYKKHLVLSEVMYHPAALSEAERLKFDSRDAFEFLELHNSGATPLELALIRFTKGIDFDFTKSAISTLAPGAALLLVKNKAAFESRYGAGLPIAGEYQGSLADGGENLKMVYGGGTPILEFAYDDDAPWPNGADGEGRSLVRVSAADNADAEKAASWAASAEPNGTPGKVASAPAPPSDRDNDGFSDASEALAGTDPNNPASRLRVTSVQRRDLTVELAWDSIPGKRYAVEFSQTLAQASWTEVGQVTANEVVTRFEDTQRDRAFRPAAYYRVAVRP